MKPIRQRKVLVSEKTSLFWWNSFSSIYCRASYSHSPNVISDKIRMWEITRKNIIFKRISKFWGPLFFRRVFLGLKQSSAWSYCDFHFRGLTIDFFSRLRTGTGVATDSSKIHVRWNQVSSENAMEIRNCSNFCLGRFWNCFWERDIESAGCGVHCTE